MFKSFYHRNLNPNVEKYRDSLLEQMIELVNERHKMFLSFRKDRDPSADEMIKRNKLKDNLVNQRIKLLKLYKNSLSNVEEDLESKFKELLSQMLAISNDENDLSVKERLKRYQKIDDKFHLLDEVNELDTIIKLNKKWELQNKYFYNDFNPYFTRKGKAYTEELIALKKQEIKENELEDDFDRQNPNYEGNKRQHVTAEDHPAYSNYNSHFVGGRRKSMKKRKRCSKSKKCRRKK